MSKTFCVAAVLINAGLAALNIYVGNTGAAVFNASVASWVLGLYMGEMYDNRATN